MGAGRGGGREKEERRWIVRLMYRSSTLLPVLEKITYRKKKNHF